MTTPLFMRDVSLTLKLTTGAGERVEYNCDAHLAAIESTAGDEVTYATLCPEGSFSGASGRSTYALHIVAAQDWSATGLARFLWDHEGEPAEFQYQAHGATTPAADATPGMTGTVSLSPPTTAARPKRTPSSMCRCRARASRRTRSPRSRRWPTRSSPPRRRSVVAKLGPVRGGAETGAAFDALRSDVQDLTPLHAQVARARLSAIMGLTPVLTGDLRSSFDAEGERNRGTITSPLAYAATIEGGSVRGVVGVHMVARTLEAEADQISRELGEGIIRARQGARVPCLSRGW